jgi:hypothetical protein
MNQFTGVNDLSRVREFFKALLDILETEGDYEIDYAQNELKNNISLIDEALKNDAADLRAIFSEIRRSYQSMYPPHGGLTDFFVWRDDFEERRKANQPLDQIKENLKDIFTHN